ncbi:MAG TPA: FG-GAP-like repeat-containing protein, partial [Pyrinomonadaceae bacterium]|nr:FG-GAP-like repeat-containing protein [Pyrinomonadaceae bacterium]
MFTALNSLKGNLGKLFAVAFVLTIAFSFSVQAAGEVDPNFKANLQQPGASGRAVAVQQDGKVLVGGNFKAANGEGRTNLARFNPDGSVDTSFEAVEVNGTVFVIKIQPDGRILIGGNFNFVGGLQTPGVARLNANGAVDASFSTRNTPNTNFCGTVYTIAPQTDGKIFIGGEFSFNSCGNGFPGLARLNSNGSIDGTFQTSGLLNIREIAPLSSGKVLIAGNGVLVRGNQNGSQDTSFTTGAINGQIEAMVIQPDDKILIAGSFTSVNGFPQGRIARLNPDGSLDAAFNLNNAGFAGTVFDLALMPDGKIIAAGNFTSYNGLARRNLLRLNPDGSLDTAFNYNAGANNQFVHDAEVLPDGRVYIAFEYVGTDPALLRKIARINADGTNDTSFNARLSINGVGYKILPLPDGKILVGGLFTQINESNRASLARLNPDGTVDSSWTPVAIGGTSTASVIDIALQSDGRILVGGDIGSPRADLLRLNADGSLDTTFNTPVSPNSVIRRIVVQPDGKILIGGSFTLSSPSTNGMIARLNSDGSPDPTFAIDNINAGSGILQDLILQPDGKILISGSFTQVFGVNRGRIARLNANGTLDTTFNPPLGANGQILKMALQLDGKIVIGGQFTAVNGANRSYLARLNPDGSLDADFVPSANAQVYTIKLQTDAKILIGGLFTGINSIQRVRYARLNANGSVDLSLDSATGANDAVLDIALQTDGRILIAGLFTSVSNQPRLGLARLLNSTSAGRTLFDYDGDGRADFTVFRPSSGFWYRLNSSNNAFIAEQFGNSADRIAPADYDADGRTDIAVWRASGLGNAGLSYFFITNSSTNTYRQEQFG